MSSLRIFLSGATGRMGHQIYDLTQTREGIEVVAGFADIPGDLSFPVYTSLDEIEVATADFDVIVDFTSAAALPKVIDFAKRTKKPLVTGSTGLTVDDERMLRELAETVPVFHAKNMSLGVTVMEIVTEKLAKLLPDFDIEIVEKHHRYKVDAPSGTAVALFEAVKRAREDVVAIEGRCGMGARNTNDVGIQAVRGGTIVGEHDVIFAGEDEVLEVTHKAGSRRIFANGALAAAAFVVKQEPGLYNMHDVLS